MTSLRKMMLEELERRNYSEGTTRHYLRFVERFAQHFGTPPDKLGPDHLRPYQAYLLKVGSWTREQSRTMWLRCGSCSYERLIGMSSASSCPIRRRAGSSQDPEPGRSGTSDRCQQQPVRAYAADGFVRHGDAPLRDCAAEDQRHRQPAHGHSCRERQGRQGS